MASTLGLSAQKYNKVSIRNARQPKDRERYHQLHVGIGLPSGVAARDDNWYSKSLAGTKAGENGMFSAQLGYTYGASKHLQFLLHGGIERLIYRMERGNVLADNDHDRTFINLNIGANYRWLVRKDFALYSGFLVGGGYSLYHPDQPNPNIPFDRTNYFYPTAQLTVFGATWGRRFGGYTEVALSTRGIIFGGVYYRIYQ
ncbi:hypothetical protein DBR32_05810 [Taibaiella sp. KBW10]|uniref:hypothetical protein n=1 Tax=Taibaiella sp. KBW10 TaxID=2153357 RepID=UPI000F5A7F3D|nr:hypothetical protein [Taibaiella sp. KBW10]RQO31475.1 hypothetical protein DBR32_05810 [Taibaiella sp. KBW10]